MQAKRSTHTKLTSPTHTHTHTHFRRLTVPGFTDHPRLSSQASAAIGRRCLFCVCLGAAGRPSPGARSSCGPPQTQPLALKPTPLALCSHKTKQRLDMGVCEFLGAEVFSCVGAGCEAGEQRAGGRRPRRRCRPHTLLTQTATPLPLSPPPCCTDGPALDHRLPHPAQRPMGSPVIISSCVSLRVVCLALGWTGHQRAGLVSQLLFQTHPQPHMHTRTKKQTRAHKNTGNLRPSSGTWICARPTYVCVCVGSSWRRRWRRV